MKLKTLTTITGSIVISAVIFNILFNVSVHTASFVLFFAILIVLGVHQYYIGVLLEKYNDPDKNNYTKKYSIISIILFIILAGGMLVITR